MNDSNLPPNPVDEAQSKRRTRLRRGAYLLPSTMTIGNILLGFYAVVLAVRGGPEAFQRAAVMIFIAGILDALDGRIARLTGTESEFGREFDSLADVLTFGAAPAYLAYLWGLSELGRFGWLIPVLYLVCTATRLARFNVRTKVVDSRYFVGLPSPAAAGSVCSMLFFAPDSEWKPWLTIALIVALGLLGVLEISTFRYASFKRFDLRQRWSYRFLLPVASVILVVAWRPTAAFMAIAIAYTLSGPVAWLVARLRRSGKRSETPKPTSSESSG